MSATLDFDATRLSERRVVLMLDAATATQEAIRAVAGAGGLPVAVAGGAAAAAAQVHARGAALVLADLRLGDEVAALARTPGVRVVALWSGQGGRI